MHYGKRKGQYGYFLPPEVKIRVGLCDILGLAPYLKLNNLETFGALQVHLIYFLTVDLCCTDKKAGEFYSPRLVE